MRRLGLRLFVPCFPAFFDFADITLSPVDEQVVSANQRTQGNKGRKGISLVVDDCNKESGKNFLPRCTAYSLFEFL